MRGIFREYYRAISRRTPLVAISDAQRRALPDANWLATVHNAVDVDAFEVREDKDDMFLFLGRICRDKGTHLAAEAARQAGRRLVIAGRIAEPRERRYFKRKVEPLLGDGVEYVGEADFDTKRELLRRARALLCPAQWDEPFGMVLIEALASGTPVITFDRGAAREIVDDGETGAIVGSVEEMAEAMRTLDADPKRCRSAVEERFDVTLMVERYEAVMRSFVEDRRTSLSAV
jgi:glycosyltransferase involved in cell wall biosynthesis